MEGISPPEDTRSSLPVPHMDETSSTSSQIYSQGYAAVPTTEEISLHHDTTTSSTSLIQGSILSDTTRRAISEDNSCNVAATSGYQEKHNMSTVATSLNKALRSRSRSRFQDIREILVKFWLWEAAACVLSLMCFASIVGILAFENGKLLDEWDWAVPPTAVVSFIGTLGKASMVLVLSQVMSQLKWLHFTQTKSLSHIRTFDGASRGPLGALLVIWDSKRLLASAAACLMVLVILVDPFVQLVFTFPSMLVEDNSQQAVFYHVKEYYPDSYDHSGVDTSLNFSPEIVTSITRGFATNTTPTAICPSGNCTWSGPIKTLGVCGSCSDVTADVKISCSPLGHEQHEASSSSPINVTRLTCSYMFSEGTTIQSTKLMADNTIYGAYRTVWNSTTLQGLPDGAKAFHPNKTRFELDGQSISPQPTGIVPVEPGQDPMALVDYVGLLGNFGAIQFPIFNETELTDSNERAKMPAAKCWNCSMHWCERSYEAMRISNNAPLTYRVSTVRLVLIWLSDATYGLYPAEVDGLNQTVWNFRYRMSSELNNYMEELFQSYFVETDDGAGFRTDGFPYMDLSQNTPALMGLALSKDLNATVHALADSLTESIRTSSNFSSSAIGQTFVPRSFIQVRWEWLALPLALIVMTCALLVIVAVKSHSDQVAVWKDDPLALLFHNVKGVDILPGGNYRTGTSDLDNLASEVHVKLDRDRPFKFFVSAKQD